MKLPTIRQLPSGSWFCRLRIGGRDICITEPTEAKCRAKAMAYKTGVLQAKKAPVDKTLRQACQAYINARPKGSPTTRHTNETYVKFAFQGIMDKKLKDITKADFINAVAEECQRETRRHETIAPVSVHKEFDFICAVLRENDIEPPQINNLPAVQQLPVVLPEPSDVLRAIVGSSIELPCLLAAWLSLTQSEIRALTKSKSIKNGKLYINETVVRVGGQDIRKKGSKEEKRSRVHTIPPHIQQLINQQPGDVLCPFTPRQLYGRFQTLQRRAGVDPPISFHQLRHLNASVMAMLGVQKEIARERGGWHNDAVMDQVYTHTFTSARRSADASIDAYFADKIGNKNGNESKKRRIYKLFKP